MGRRPGLISNKEVEYRARQLTSPVLSKRDTENELNQMGQEGWHADAVLAPNADHRVAAGIFSRDATQLVYEPIEYRVEPFVQLARDTSVANQQLCALGRDGWQLVAIYQAGVSNRYSFGVYCRAARVAEDCESPSESDVSEQHQLDPTPAA